MYLCHECRDESRPLCLSWRHCRAWQEDKHKAPTQPLHIPLSLRNLDFFSKNLGVSALVVILLSLNVSQHILK